MKNEAASVGALLYFEDFTPGRRFRSHDVTIGADEIIAFANSFDPQPFHTEPEAAQDSFFGAHVASGWHTATLTMRLMVDALPVAGGLIGAGVKNIRWLRPVTPGERLHAEIEVISARASASRPGIGIVGIRVTTLNGNGETVQVMEPSIVVPRAGRL